MDCACTTGRSCSCKMKRATGLAEDKINASRVDYWWFFFFFQAEDGIRDWSVTGVQTCALPIWRSFDVLLQFDQRGRLSGVLARRTDHDADVRSTEHGSSGRRGRVFRFLPRRK